jgi:hypothetical protein
LTRRIAPGLRSHTLTDPQTLAQVLEATR